MDIKGTRERTALFDLLGRTIHGTAGDDVLFAEAEWEHLIGFGGKDVLTSAFNNTWLDGGDDNDDLTSVVIAQSMGGNPVEAMAMQEGGDGEDRLNAKVLAPGVDVDSSATTSLDGGRNGDVITATSSVDSGGQGTFASAENDIWGGCGDDTINSVAYVDATLADVMAVNRIYGGRGNDEIDVRAEIEQLSLTQTGLASNEVYGGAGHDWIKAVADTDFSGFDSSATNVLFGGRGNDTLDAAATVDSNDGELAANTLYGGAGNDDLHASTRTATNGGSPDATNTLVGGHDDDVLVASQYAANFARTEAVNALDGGAGNDSLTADITARSGYYFDGENLLEGGSGEDILTAHLVVEGINIVAAASNTLKGGAGDDNLTATLQAKDYGSAPVEPENILNGGDGDDVLTATITANSAGRNSLYGEAGNDELTAIGGWGGTLDGGEGRDLLTGGEGNDEFIGGSGEDRFEFTGPDFGDDVVTDFDDAGNDVAAFISTTLTFGDFDSSGDNKIDVNDVGANVTFTDGDLTLIFDATNSVTFVDTADLSQSDLIFS